MKSWTLFLLLALATSPPAARADALEPLLCNGSVFYRGEERMPLRCLDAPTLLAMDVKSQGDLLDKAAAAGFNSVSFSAPLFGEGSFCVKLGTLEAERVAAFHRLIEEIENRRLYAFPVLWNVFAVDAFSKMGGGEEKFFTGKIQNQWQAWLTKETIKAADLSATAGIGGWILYRGPWPGPKQRVDASADTGAGARAGEHASGAQAFTAGQRSWLSWQVRALRQAGAIQLTGLGYMLKGDLEDKKAAEEVDYGASSALGPPPVSEKSKVAVLVPDAKEMDKLPPLPGDSSQEKGAQAGETLTPWDLEGVDWDSVGRALNEVPMATGLDFMELTLDTQDWYRIGEAMSDMTIKNIQVPLLWRQDWRGVSRYERQKHLEAPEGLAGLAGAWPDADWPETGESIWPVSVSSQVLAKPLLFKYMEVVKDSDGEPAIALHLNRPAEIELKWGKAWPLTKRSGSKEAALVHVLSLKGAHFGQNILFMARAKSRKWGSAVLKTRWTVLKKPIGGSTEPKPAPRKAKKKH